MGGSGSGRHWYPGTRDTTSEYRSIDVRRWQKDGLLTSNQSFGWQWSRDGETVASIQVHPKPNQVLLYYRHRSYGKDWKAESYPVRLDWTPCNYGGERPWFLCPANGCGRRVAILYGGGSIFACRYCHKLAYDSQREGAGDRAARRANKIREKLGWQLGVLNVIGWKPKGMHWNTFERLSSLHDAFAARTLASIIAQLNLSSE